MNIAINKKLKTRKCAESSVWLDRATKLKHFLLCFICILKAIPIFVLDTHRWKHNQTEKVETILFFKISGNECGAPPFVFYNPTELLQIEQAPVVKKEPTPTSSDASSFCEFINPQTSVVVSATGAAAAPLSGLALATPGSLPDKEVFCEDEALLSTPLL